MTIKPRLFPVSTALAVFASAIVTTILFLAWQSQSLPEVPENLVFGAAIGVLVGVTVTFFWLAVFPILRWGIHRSPAALRAAVAVGAIVLGVVACMGLLALETRQPMRAFLVLASPGTIAAAFLAAFGASSRSPLRAALALLGCESIVIASIALLGPLHARPDTLHLADTRADDLIVMSWNCGLGNPNAGPSRREDLPAIAHAIEQSGAQVVCLQEVGDENRGALLQLLGDPWRGVSNEQSNGWSDSIITKLPGTLQVQSIPNLPHPTAGARIAYEGRIIELLSVHLSPGAASGWRKDQAAALLDYAHNAGHAVLVAGDMNLDPQCVWDRWLPFFSDAVQRDWDAQGLLCEVGVDAGAGGSATATLSRRIDRILVPARWVTSEYRVLYHRKIGRMDHHPIMVKIRPGREANSPSSMALSRSY